jgi:hypothetical protein
MTDEAENVVRHLLADEQQEQIQSYLQRGRVLESLTDGELREQFIGEMRSWASQEPPWEPLTRLDDIKAECALRDIELPWEAVEDSFNVIKNAFDAFVSRNMPQEDTDYLEKKITQYHKQQSRKN